MSTSYVLNEIGLFPSDWNVKPCSEISERIMVGIVIRPAQYYVSSGVPALRSANVRAEGISRSDLVFMSEHANSLLAKSQLRTGDVVTVRTGYPGTSAVVPADLDGANCIDILITRPSPAVDSRFLAAWINSPFGKNQVLKNQGGLAQKHFNVGDMRNLLVALPSLPEQRAIVAALNDAEQVEASLGRSITKKVAIRQGMVQELLSGRTRLPGFRDQWPEVTLASVATGLRGSGLSKEQLAASGLYPCLLYGELFTTYGRRIDRVRSRTNAKATVQSQVGDVLVPGSTTTVARDLATASAMHLSGVLIGGDTNIVRPGRSLNPDWLAHYITYELRDRVAEVAQGLTIKHLYVRDLLQCSIPLPPVAEQLAIVDALADAEAELSSLQKRAEKARAIKNGMMQELLTGRIRLPVNGAAA